MSAGAGDCAGVLDGVIGDLDEKLTTPPGDTPPSILSPPDGPLTATYVFPELEKVG